MFVTFRGFSSQKLHLSSSAQCALYLTGGRREKDRNLAIWDREGGRIKSGQGEEIKVVTTLDEIFSFLCLRRVAIFLHVFSLFPSKFHNKLFMSISNYLESKMKVPTLLRTLFNISNKIFALLSNLKGYFSFSETDFPFESFNISQGGGGRFNLWPNVAMVSFCKKTNLSSRSMNNSYWKTNGLTFVSKTNLSQ